MASKRAPIVLYGGGGHARVVLAAARAAKAPVKAIYADDADSASTFAEKHRLAVLPPAALSEPGRLFHIAIGENGVRRAIATRHATLPWCPPIIHPTAIFSGDFEIGVGSFIGAAAIVQPGARIGRHVIVNTGAIVEHDCVIGDYCHIGPGAILSGDVVLGDGVLIGAGATVLKGRKIGGWTKVGAGAAVVTDLFGVATAFGVPARANRSQTGE